MRLHQSIHFHTTSKEETNSVKLIFSSNQIFEINNLSAIHFSESIAFKRENELNLYFISRISRKKNLHYALEILREVETDGLINFKVIGPHEDEEYIKECKKIIEKLPENINVFFEGPIPPADISQAILNDHFFLFPTLGENFGHVISEAIMVNKPVILSNTTPWSDVIKKFELGYILRLENKEKWISLLENLVKLNNAEYKMYLNSFNNYKVNSAISNKNIVQKHCSMFEDIGN
jgi:glycosyltransferase involved in cell wall biosynthesis